MSHPFRLLILAAATLLFFDVTAGIHAAEADAATESPSDNLVIDGIVVTAQGVGVPDAEIRIELPDAGPEDAPLAESVTGSRGQIAITMTRPAVKQLRYRITHEGLADSVGLIDISDPDEPPFIDVTVKGAAGLFGRVTAAADDQPIAGARIQCENGGRRFYVKSGADGRYKFESVYPGAARLTVMADGFGTRRDQVDVSDEDVELDFNLRPERPVILRLVTDANEPADDVVVEALTEPLQIFSAARSDKRGIVKLPGIDIDVTALNLRLNGDRYLVMRGYEEHCDLPRIDEASQAPSSRPAAVEEKFTVTLAGRIAGTVTDKRTGEAIHNVRILAGREHRYGMPMDWSGPGGGYELVGVQPGSLVVTFQHDSYQTAFRTVELEAGKKCVLDVAMEEGTKLAGVVVDHTDLPVEQVRVAADDWEDYQTLGLRAITDAKGRFEFAHAPEGEIEFTFVLPGQGKPIRVPLASGKTDHIVKLESPAVPLATGAAPIDEAKLQPGQAVADLTLTARDGTTYKLSELRGKYVFLDCWATWCRPCMGELPNVKALYQATKGRADFVLIGISLDTDAKSLDKVCKEQGITWPQVFGPKSGASEAFEELDGVGIPYTCLIGPDGKLLAQHLRGPGMADEVKKLISPASEGTRSNGE